MQYVYLYHVMVDLLSQGAISHIGREVHTLLYTYFILMGHYTIVLWICLTNQIMRTILVIIWRFPSVKGAMSRCFSHFSDYFEIEGNLKIIVF